MKERLLWQLRTTLVPREVIYQGYEEFWEKMFSYESEDLQEELTEALKEIDFRIEEKDWEDFTLLHTEERRKTFEDKFQIKSPLYGVGLPEKSWEKFVKKNDEGESSVSIYYDKSWFKEFHHEHLYFKLFGLGLEEENKNKEQYYHETWHAVKHIYLRGWDEVRNYQVKRYTLKELRAKIEARLIDEIASYVLTDSDNELKEMIEEYLQEESDFFYKKRRLPKKEKEQKERLFGRIKENINETVEAAVFIYDTLEPAVAAPIFLTTMPTWRELKQKIYHSPFEDLNDWAKLIDNGEMTLDEIVKTLWQIDYLTD